MGRGKIEVKRIENKTSREVSFSKRRAGLLKKTHELSVLCDAQIGLIIFSSKGKLFHYSSQPHSMREVISRYLETTGASLIPVDQENRVQVYDEVSAMRRETLNLQLSLQRYKGDDLSSVQFEELHEIEKQLEFSLAKIRARKVELLQQQMENLKRTEKMLEKENQEMYEWLMRNEIKKQEAAGVMDDDEEAITELNLLGEQPLLPHFTLFGDHQPTTLIPYRLQPSHPNLQHTYD